MQWALDMGLPGADSLEDRSIPTFSRGEKPHFAGINTFLKAPFVENIRDVGKYDAAIVGVPFDGGATYRPGARVRAAGRAAHLGALHALQLRDRGRSARADDALRRRRRFRHPRQPREELRPDQQGRSHVFSSGALPLIIGGDHSIGFPCVRGIAECTSKRIGIIHFDRHLDTQAKDMDERMHNTPWYWATNLPNVSAKNLVQLGIGGWQVPRPGVEEARDARDQRADHRGHREARASRRPPRSRSTWPGRAPTRSTSPSMSIAIDCGFVPGTGWPEPGGFLPREALRILGLVAAQGICGLEVVEVRPPYDISDITSLVGTRVVVEVLGSLVAHGKMGSAQGADRQAGQLLTGARHARRPRPPLPITGTTMRTTRMRCPATIGKAGAVAGAAPAGAEDPTPPAERDLDWSRQASLRASGGPRTRRASCGWPASPSSASTARAGGCTCSGSRPRA